MRCRTLSLLLAVAAVALSLPQSAEAGRPRVNHEAMGRQTFTSPQVNPIAVSPDGTLVLVAATTSSLVDVIDTAQGRVIRRIHVGIDPVSISFKPDGSEAWVSNHVSDSVSVIDTTSGSPGYLAVVETVQDVDPAGVTLFDEPVGIAFSGDGSQAYVALSSRNDVAIVNAGTYTVTGRVHVTNQEPRAIAVKGDRLYVLAFESGNKSQLSACETLGDDTECTLDISNLLEFVTTNPNIPSGTKNIIIDNDASYPDRDLFVWNISGGLSDGAVPLDVVEGLGTLLYGLVVGNQSDTVFVTQTEARNADNGSHLDVLATLQNRIFFNRMSEVDCTGPASNPCGAVTLHELEPAPGSPVGLPLATPYGIVIDADDNLVVATAAASSRIFSWDVNNGAGPGKVLGSADLGSIPRGIALHGNTAYVLNTLSNKVSTVTVDTNPASGTFGDLSWNPVDDITVGADPTPDPVRLGRIAFNDANASNTGTFSCASCHPDGNTDQLLWRIGGDCSAAGCPAGDEPRTTMPVRGLRDTVPLHWDGALGDPFGGPDGSGATGLPPSQTSDGDTCTLTNQVHCFRHLVEGALSGVMCDQNPSCAVGSSGEAGQLDDTERGNMAVFLENVAYPPARSRAWDDVPSAGSIAGFQDFFMDNPENRGSFLSSAANINDPETCADSTAGCHTLPLGVDSNSSTLGNFDVPTMRGMTDRYFQFSVGLTNTQEMLVGMNDGIDIGPFVGFPPGLISSIAQPFGTWTEDIGFEETFTFGVAFAVFDAVYGGTAQNNFQLFEEASTGYSGALGRQVTINSATAAGAPSSEADDLLAPLEVADERGLVNLRGQGVRDLGGDNFAPILISYDPDSNPTDPYKVGGARLSRADMMTEALAGDLVATLTAQLRSDVSEATPMPLLSVPGASCGTPNLPNTTGSDPRLPLLSGGNLSMALESKYVTGADEVYLDGAPAGVGSGIVVTGSTPVCSDAITPDEITVTLAALPSDGPHVIQIRTGGLLSNELPICVNQCAMP